MSSSGKQFSNAAAIVAQPHLREVQRYLQRHGYSKLQQLPAPDPDLELVVVVPALAEPDAVATLESVATATAPAGGVELLLVVNGSEAANLKQRAANARCLEAARTWAAQHGASHLTVHILDYQDLPADRAGVGLARKIGMDTALQRLSLSKTGNGIIVSLDADSSVSPNYLVAIENYFLNAPDAVGGTIGFEHAIASAPAQTRSAIIEYELHLRCYRHGLIAADSAYAFYTIGSAFAVRSGIYAQEGGMNTRQAGEDFYFINKLLKRGIIGEVHNACVYPSARISDRVPFGTGAALARAADEKIKTYAPACYLELKQFQNALYAHVLHDNPIPQTYAPFLATAGFEQWLRKTRNNVASDAALSLHLRRWLDCFRTMKFIHWYTESGHPRVAVTEAAAEIFSWSGQKPVQQPRALLEQFRALDQCDPA